MPRPSPRRDYQTVRFPPFDFASAVMPSIGAKPFSASVARFCPRCCTSSALGCLRAPRRATRDVTPGRARLGAGRSEPNATSLRKPIAAAVTPLGAGSRPNENRIRYAAKSTVWHYSASLDASSRRMPKRNPRSHFAAPSECHARTIRLCQTVEIAAHGLAKTRNRAARGLGGQGADKRGKAAGARPGGTGWSRRGQAGRGGRSGTTGTHTKHEPRPRRSRPKRNGAPRRALRADAAYAFRVRS